MISFRSISLLLVFIISLGFSVQAQDTTVSLDQQYSFEEGATYSISDSQAEIEITSINEDTVYINGEAGSGTPVSEDYFAELSERNYIIVNCYTSDSSFTGVLFADTEEDPIQSADCEDVTDWQIKNMNTGEKAGKGELLYFSYGTKIGFAESEATRTGISHNGGVKFEARETAFDSEKVIYPGFIKEINLAYGDRYDVQFDGDKDLFVCETNETGYRLTVSETNYRDNEESFYNNCRENLADRDSINIDLEEDRPVFIGKSPTTLSIEYSEGTVEKQVSVDSDTVQVGEREYYDMKNPGEYSVLGDKAKIRLGEKLFVEKDDEGKIQLTNHEIDNPSRNLLWEVTASGFYFLNGDKRTQIHHDGNSVDAYIEGSDSSQEYSFSSAEFMVEGQKLFDYCSSAEDNYETVGGIQFFRMDSAPSNCVSREKRKFRIKTRDADDDNFELMRRYEDETFDLESEDRFTIYRGGSYRIRGLEGGQPITELSVESIGQEDAEISISDKQQGVFFPNEDCGYRSGNIRVTEGENVGIPEEGIFLKANRIIRENTGGVEFNVLDSRPNQLKTPDKNECSQDETEDSTDSNRADSEQSSPETESRLELYSTSVTSNMGERVINERTVEVSPMSQTFLTSASVSNEGEQETEVTVAVKQGGSSILEKSSKVQSNRGTTFEFDISRQDIEFSQGTATIKFQVVGTELSETKTLQLNEPEYDGQQVELGQKITVQQGDSLIFENSQLNIGELEENPFLSVETGNGRLGTVTFEEENSAQLRFQDGTHYVKGCSYSIESGTAEIIISDMEDIGCEELEQESQKDSISIRTESGIEVRQEIEIGINVPENIEQRYQVVINSPSNQKVFRSTYSQTEKTVTFTPEQNGEYTVKILPQALGGNLPFVGNLLQGGSLAETTISVSSPDQAQWKTYCAEQNYQAEQLSQQINCIEEEIIPEYFEDSTGEEPRIAESLCQDLLGYSYSSEENSCMP